MSEANYITCFMPFKAFVLSVPRQLSPRKFPPTIDLREFTLGSIVTLEPQFSDN